MNTRSKHRESKPAPTAPSGLLTFWRVLTKFDASDISVSMAARNAICIAAPLALGVLLGRPGSGLIAASGALNASFSDGHDPYKRRVQKMAASSVMCGIAVFFGASTGHNHVMAVCLSSAWAFAVGMLAALGTAASDVGNISLFTLCVYASQSMNPTDAALSGLLATAGGLLQTASALVLWPTRPYDPERRALSLLYLALADMASSITQQPDAPPGTAQLTRAQTVVNSLSKDRTEDAERFQALLQHGELIRLSLLVLGRLRRRLARETPDAEGPAAIDHFAAEFSSGLRIFAAGVRTGHYDVVPNFTAARSLALEIEKQEWPEGTPFAKALFRDIKLQLSILIKQVEGVLELLQRVTVKTPRDVAEAELPKPWKLRLRGRGATLFANLNLESAVFRHALRLAVCIAVGDATARALHFGRSYWATMTVAIVLKPDFSATFSRGILRIAGTMAGLTLATLLFHASPHGQMAHVVFIALLSFFMRWLGPGNYGIVAVAVSAIVVIMIAGTGVQPGQVISARAINTTLGGVLALVFYALWPTWEGKRIRPMIADLLDSYRIYFRNVMETYRGGEESDLDDVRYKARVARTNVTASLDRAAVEPATNREDLVTLNAIVARSNDFVRCVMALEAAPPENRSACDTPEFRAFIQIIDDALACLAREFRTNHDERSCLEPLAKVDPHLSADPYSLLNMEAERMVRALDLLAGAIR